LITEFEQSKELNPASPAPLKCAIAFFRNEEQEICLVLQKQARIKSLRREVFGSN